jgi:Tfp pilus assembly protein PilF
VSGRLRDRLGRWLLIAALLAITCLGLFIGGAYAWAGYHFRAARKALAQREYLTAWDHLQDSLRVWPRDGATRLLAAQAARRAGLFGEAERQLDQYVRVHGPSEEVTLERVLNQAQQGELPPDREQWLRGRIEAEPEQAVLILEALAQGCIATYRLHHALDYLAAWLEREPDAVPALLSRGWVQERIYWFEQAREDYRRAVALAPNDTEARLRLAQNLGLGGDSREAAEHFEWLRERQPDNPIVVMGLAQAKAKLGAMEEARQLLDALALRFPQEAPVLLERGRVALQMGRPEEAEPWLRRAVAAAPYEYQPHYSLVQCLNQLGKVSEARVAQERTDRLEAELQKIDQMTEAIQSHPYDPAPRCEIGKTYLSHQKDALGLHWLRSALRVSADYAPAHAALAEYYERTGQPILAARHRRQAGEARD